MQREWCKKYCGIINIKAQPPLSMSTYQSFIFAFRFDHLSGELSTLLLGGVEILRQSMKTRANCFVNTCYK